MIKIPSVILSNPCRVSEKPWLESVRNKRHSPNNTEARWVSDPVALCPGIRSGVLLKCLGEEILRRLCLVTISWDFSVSGPVWDTIVTWPHTLARDVCTHTLDQTVLFQISSSNETTQFTMGNIGMSLKVTAFLCSWVGFSLGLRVHEAPGHTRFTLSVHQVLTLWI